MNAYSSGDVVHHPLVADVGEGFISPHTLCVLGSALGGPDGGVAVLPLIPALRVPGAQPGAEVQTDEEIDAFVRQAVESAYHPSCSCKMGTDELAVVDPETRVHGIRNLRVVDSSIFPTIPNGNLNSPTIMLAERAADLIRGREPLQPSDAPVVMDDQWQTRQRPGQAKRALA